MELSSLELKFLLRLLEYSPSYRTRIGKIKPETKTTAAERDRICKSLYSKGLVAYTDDIRQYRTEPAGKTLLRSDTSQLPVSSAELALLQAAVDKAVPPGEAKQVPPSDRQRLLQQLRERGLIRISKQQISEVWLTAQGRQYLLKDCTPTNANAKLSFSMLGTYLTFLRQSLGQVAAENPTTSEQFVGSEKEPNEFRATDWTPETVLDQIRQLDQQLDTDNFLPIFHLRNKLQPSLNREDLDQLLYDLQSRDLIEFSTLQDVSNYSEAEVAAGIAQTIGGSLFYISVT